MQEILKIGTFLFIAGGIAFVAMMVTGICRGKAAADDLKNDENKPSQSVVGKILEKTVDTRRENAGLVIEYTIEWVVIEDMHGTRRKVRNVKPREILLTTGDVGEFMLRGDTIYNFRRMEKTAQSFSQEKIPAWQRVEMEKAEAERKAAEEE